MCSRTAHLCAPAEILLAVSILPAGDSKFKSKTSSDPGEFFIGSILRCFVVLISCCAFIRQVVALTALLNSWSFRRYYCFVGSEQKVLLEI